MDYLPEYLRYINPQKKKTSKWVYVISLIALVSFAFLVYLIVRNSYGS